MRRRPARTHRCTGSAGASLLALLLVLATAPVFAASPVVRVKDGDSLVVRSGGQEAEVRLAYIDAPELDQPWGRRAGEVLRFLVAHRSVELELLGGDVHGRIVARVLRGNLDVNAEMVRRGFAWVRREYPHPAALAQVEAEARTKRRGLWADAEPVPPWLWRKDRSKRKKRQRDKRKDKRGERGGSAADGAKRKASEGSGQRAATPEVPAVQCGTKRYCREMTSCEEARAYLRQCKLRTIDGDGDGNPCEKLCR